MDRKVTTVIRVTDEYLCQTGTWVKDSEYSEYIEAAMLSDTEPD